MKKVWIALLITIALLTGCSQSDKEVIAQVGDEVLTMHDIKQNFTTTEWDAMNAIQKREIVQQWVDLTVLAQEADNEDLGKNATVKFRIKNAIKRVKVNALIAKKIAEIKITEEEMFNFYRLHKADYMKKTKEYKIQRILVYTDQEANAIVKQISDGALKFSDAAKMYSREPVGRFGGYTGFVTEADSTRDFWAAVDSLQQFQCTVVKNTNGYFIVRYYDYRESDGEKTFEQAKADIKEKLIEQKRTEIYNQVLDEVKTEKTISIAI